MITPGSPGSASTGPKKRFAIVGAGWAGLAAAIDLIGKGHRVCVFEAARSPGGRARRVDWRIDGNRSIPIDNGQHILLGAYRSTLALLKTLGIVPEQVFHRIPLTLQSSTPGFRLRAPRLPAPLHLIAALLGARGLGWADAIAAVRLVHAARRFGWRLQPDRTVNDWLDAQRQTPRLRKNLWEPLCIAALNTPPQIASAQIFLHVLRDSVGAGRADSDFLLPSVDLGALMPEPASKLIAERGELRLGCRVSSLSPRDRGVEVRIDTDRAGGSLANDSAAPPLDRYDGAVVAVSAEHVPALLEGAALGRPEFSKIVQQCRGFSWQPIVTAYLLYECSPFSAGTPPLAMLDCQPARGDHGQWIFDRERLGGKTGKGLVAVVISADGPHRNLSGDRLLEALSQQLVRQLGTNLLPLASRLIVEKRAGFACTPDLDRPGNRTPDPRIVLAGDYTASDDAASNYPATIESAVRSGLSASAILTAAVL